MSILDSVEIFIQNPHEVYPFDLDQNFKFFRTLSADLQKISNSENAANQDLRVKARYFFVHTLFNEIGLARDQREYILGLDWAEIYQQGFVELNDSKKIHFNWSHSEDFLALAFSSSSVGVDVEKIKARHSLWQSEQKAQKIFTDFERQTLLVTADENAFWIRFFEIWTQKESVLKLHRQGLTGLKLLNEGQLVATKTETYEFENWILSASSTESIPFRIHTPTMHQV